MLRSQEARLQGESSPVDVGSPPRTRRPVPVLTEGPIGRTLLLFSLPILGSSILQSLNASINAIWIGRLIGANALAAVSNGNNIMFFLISAGFGLGMAATILVGQGLGARNIVQVKRTIGTTLVFFAGLSLVVGAGGFFGASKMLAALHSPPEVLGLATAYLKVVFVSLPAIYLYTFVMMALRGAGDARTPLIFLSISAVLDVGLNPILIISDNNCYGTISMHHVMRYPGRPFQSATNLKNPDFAVWASAFGAEGITISDEAEVAPGIARAFSVRDRPVVVHVHSSAEQMSAWRRRN